MGNLFHKIKTPWGMAIIAVVLVVFVGAIAFCAVATNKLGKDELIAPNVWVNNVRLDNMSVVGAANAIRTHYENYAQKKSVSFTYEGITKTIPLEMVDAKVDINATIQNAYNVGRSPHWLNNAWKYITLKFVREEIPLEIDMDTIALKEKIQDFANAIDVQNNAYSVDEKTKTLTVNKNATAKMVDVDATYDSAIRAIKKGTPDKAELITAEKASWDKKAHLIRKRVPTEPVDAKVYSENGDAVYVPQKNGIEFDVSSLKAALESESMDGEVIVPISVRLAEVTEEVLRARLFKDVLAEYTTKYDGSIIGRTQNVKMAANNINGTMILPGQNFSFNRTVGERTYAAGFADGRVFSGGQVIDGVGGGICQVSSTLYSVVLFANLEVVERHNHTFAITYAPLGQDATVAYGALDFVFKNDTAFPIKVVTTMGGGSLNVKILGTKLEGDNTTIEIVNSTVGTRPFATTTKPNPNPSAVRDVVDQAGISGYTVDTYKIYKENGIEVKREFLHRSVYKPLEKIVLEPQNALPPMATNAPVATVPPIATPTPTKQPPTPTDSQPVPAPQE
ncbi:hypothetical protein FACS189425_04130 [Clostridia bacterium]|nr:hypothetical protein FACS189425_04130 [Clostridia bacterium]